MKPRKKTIAVGVLGVAAVALGIGVQVKARRDAEHKRELIELTEQLLREKWSLNEPRLVMDYHVGIRDLIIANERASELRLHIDGAATITTALKDKAGTVIHSEKRVQQLNDLNVELEKKDGTWLIVGDGFVVREYESTWDRITRYARSWWD